MNEILLAAVLLISSSAGAASASKAAAPSAIERIMDMYVEARVAHILVEERVKNVIGLKPFDSLGRYHADYQHGVVFLESRPVVPASLHAAALALPKKLPAGPWARYLMALTQKELRHAEEDRAAGRKYIETSDGFGPEVAGLVPWAKLQARSLDLLGADPYGPPLKIVDALAEPLDKAAILPYTDPAYPLYLRAQGRILKRIVGAFAADSDRMVSEAPALTRAEIKRIFGPNLSAFHISAASVFRGLENDLKNCPPFKGAGAVHAEAARKELSAAAAEAARARAALAPVKSRVEAIDAEITARYKPTDDDDDFGPDTLMPDFRSWTMDLEKIEKGCLAAASAISAKLPAKP